MGTVIVVCATIVVIIGFIELIMLNYSHRRYFIKLVNLSWQSTAELEEFLMCYEPSSAIPENIAVVKRQTSVDGVALIIYWGNDLFSLCNGSKDGVEYMSWKGRILPEDVKKSIKRWIRW